MSEFKVGDKLWYVGRDWGGCSCEVTVTKVGRIWVTLSNLERFEKNGRWTTDNGRCYASKEYYQNNARADDLWQQLCHGLMYWPRPPTLDEAAIREMAKMAEITLK
jgi:hypothetical protein